MQIQLLALLLLQPERTWSLKALARAIDAPASSVHRELRRAESAGIIHRDNSVRPHLFTAAEDEPFTAPMAELLRMSVGVEQELRTALKLPGVEAAVIHGSWATGRRKPESDIDVLIVGDVSLQKLRRAVRPIGKRAGRTIDLTLFDVPEFRRMFADRASFAHQVLEGKTRPLIGDLRSLVGR
jgi:predicted nucleotidyltransferase